MKLKHFKLYHIALPQRERRDAAREHLIRYFIDHGYGQQRYTEQEIREMFRQMDTVGRLFPWGSGTKMIDCYCKWRKSSSAAGLNNGSAGEEGKEKE